jgi:hypothetical protein
MSFLEYLPADFRRNARCILAVILFIIPAKSQVSPPLHSSNPGQTSSGQQAINDQGRLTLEKEKLDLELEKLRIENANSQRSLTTRRGWLNLLYGNVSVIVAIVLGLIGFFR